MEANARLFREVDMALTGLIGAVSAGACLWALAVTGICQWLDVQAYAETFGMLALGTGGLALVSYGAILAHRSGPWFECHKCHGRYRGHDVEEIAPNKHECDFCLATRPEAA